MADHEYYEDRISLYVDGALSEKETAELRSHIAVCPDCAELLAIYQAVRGALGDAPEPPAELSGRVMAAVREINASKASPRGRKHQVVILRIAAAAACLALAFVGIRALPSLTAQKSADCAATGSIAVTSSAAADNEAELYTYSAGSGAVADCDAPAEGALIEDNAEADVKFSILPEAPAAQGDECSPAEAGEDRITVRSAVTSAPDGDEGKASFPANGAVTDSDQIKGDAGGGAYSQEPSDYEVALEVYVPTLPPELDGTDRTLYRTDDDQYYMYIPAELALQLIDEYGYESIGVTEGASLARLVVELT